MLTQRGEGHGDLGRSQTKHIGESDRVVHRRFDPVEDERVARLICVIDDVIDRPGEPVGVIAIDSSQIGPGGKRVDDVVCDPVAVMLAVPQCPGEITTVRVANEIVKDPCGRIGVLASFSEEPSESLVGLAQTSNARRLLRGLASVDPGPGCSRPAAN